MTKENAIKRLKMLIQHKQNAIIILGGDDMKDEQICHIRNGLLRLAKSDLQDLQYILQELHPKKK